MPTEPHVVVIGAGPVGLTAAAHLALRRMPFTVLEAGDAVGASIRQWGHVRLFSPWAMDIDPDAAALLRQIGWTPPAAGEHPTGHDLVDRYLEPLAAHPGIRPRLRLGATVTAITRQGRSRLDTDGRADSPFLVRYTPGWRRAGDHGDRRPRRLGHLDDAQPAGRRRHPRPRRAGRRRPDRATASPTCSAPTGPATPTSASPSPAAATPPPTCCSTWPPSAPPRRAPR